MSEKIKPHHLERKAILYIRQSSAYQVSNNTESQKLQYAMQERLPLGRSRDSRVIAGNGNGWSKSAEWWTHYWWIKK